MAVILSRGRWVKEQPLELCLPRLNTIIIITGLGYLFNIGLQNKHGSLFFCISILTRIRTASELTHWGWDKIAAIFQTFWNAFSWMRMYEFRLRFHLILWSNRQTPVRIIRWWPTTKMLIKACFLIQPLEQEGGCQKCSISLCSKVFINHFYQKKASPECLDILIYWSKYWVDRLRRTLRRKV